MELGVADEADDDAAADVRMAKQCLSEPRHLQAAIAYYSADEPGLHPTSPSDPFAAEHEALLRTPPQPPLYSRTRGTPSSFDTNRGGYETGCRL